MLALNQPDALNLIRSGSVDVFAALMDAEGNECHRIHLFRMEEQEAAVGFTSKLDKNTIRFFIQPSINAEITTISLSEAMSVDNPAARIVHTFHLLNWCQTLAETFSTQADLEAVGLVSEEDYEQEWRSKLDAFHERVADRCRARFKNWISEQEQLLSARRDGDQYQIHSAVDALAKAAGSPSLKRRPSPSSRGLQSSLQLIFQHMKIKADIPDEDLDARGDPLAQICQRCRVGYRKTRLASGWQNQNNGPFLAFASEDGRPLGLIPENNHSYRFHDPLKGEEGQWSTSDGPELQNLAYSFYPSLPDRSLTYLDLFRFLQQHGQISDLLSVLGYALLAGMLSLFIPLLTGRIFDVAIPSASLGMLAQFGLGLGAFALATSAFQMAQAFTQTRLQAKSLGNFQAALFDRILQLPVSFFRRYNSGEVTNRTMDLTNLQSFFESVFFQILLVSAQVLFSTALLFYFDWQLGGIAIAICSASALVSTFLALRMVQWQRRRMDRNISGKSLQLLMGVTKIRVAGAEDRAFASWANDYAPRQEATRRSTAYGHWLIVINAGLPVIALAVVFSLALTRLDPTAPGALSFGQFIALNAALGALVNGFVNLSELIASSAALVPTIARLRPMLEEVPDSGQEGRVMADLKGKVEINQIRFRYQKDGPLILNNVSFRVREGQFIAIVGPSGSGKSTLFRLLMGFETPIAGDVFFDEKPLSTLDLGHVRRQMGVVLQNSRVMPGSLYENISGILGLSLEETMEAARLANLDKDIKEMPMGLHTVVSENATTLSGGQRQRLLIAAAIARKPPLFIMDEATSALDNRSQELVSQSLNNMGVTRLVVAHRLSTIRKADCIHVLDKGQIVESGTYDELFQRKGLFHDMVRRQTLEADSYSK